MHSGEQVWCRLLSYVRPHCPWRMLLSIFYTFLITTNPALKDHQLSMKQNFPWSQSLIQIFHPCHCVPVTHERGQRGITAVCVVITEYNVWDSQACIHKHIFYSFHDSDHNYTLCLHHISLTGWHTTFMNRAGRAGRMWLGLRAGKDLQ